MKRDFMWITGIEDTFVSATDSISARPLDEYELTQHYSHWKEDLRSISNTGFKYIRYGIPWYTINPEKGRYDFSWTDRVFDFMREIGLIPIVDFIHYGTPSWMDNGFLNNDFPLLMAEYELTVMNRYKDFLKYYTPMNEPFITQEFCGKLSVWPPYLKGDDGFVKLLNATARGIVETVSSIKRELPEAFALHVEASGLFFSDDPDLAETVTLMNELRYATYDLVQGLINNNHPLIDYLRRNGMSYSDLDWFLPRKIEIDGFGVNYYPQLSVYRVFRSGKDLKTHSHYGSVEYLRELLLSYHRRYGGPIFLTETSINGEPDHQIRWWRESRKLFEDLLDEGLNLGGYTWFPAMDLINWDYRYGTAPVECYLEPMGFIQLKMNPGREFERRKGELARAMEEDLKRI
ncbi:family 1 glycosylhydrolase [Mesotoga sp. B105.6.4]|uniref:family 1 glycosylhydrolase n=1 Tax=Mesotoga sp. B105.6.4 TaxID=1582224 RepID=UPI000CCC7076|nr:family 1 glycosylhydrolase [Mesotoga sp. B105.6.4]